MKLWHILAASGLVALSFGAIALKPQYVPGTLPDYPGAINHTLTDPTTTICNKNWSTSSIRPPTSYTNPLKAKRLAEFNAKYGTTYKMADGELDHIISIELLGDPTDPNNLDFEPYNIPMGAHQKDSLENDLHRRVCNGSITVAEAQKEIRTDWVAAYNNMLSNDKKFGAITGLVPVNSEVDNDDF